MPVLYKPSKYAFFTEGESLTEKEHASSCDINTMMRNLHKGMDVRTNGSFRYGYDDTTLDGVQFRIQKQQLEKELSEVAKQTEFSETELSQIPPQVQKKFGFKKAVPKPGLKNDDKTTKKQPVKESAKKTELEPEQKNEPEE